MDLEKEYFEGVRDSFLYGKEEPSKKTKDFLLECIKEDPYKYATEPRDISNIKLLEAIYEFYESEELIKMTTRQEVIEQREICIDKLHRATRKILDIDPSNLDAAHAYYITDIHSKKNIAYELSKLADQHKVSTEPAYLRLLDACARYCLEQGATKKAVHYGEKLVKLLDRDRLGINHTLALAYARLEDARKFELIEHLERTRRLRGKKESTWTLLARIILLYKQGNLTSAKRALLRFCSSCPGGAYALLENYDSEAYILMRPPTKPRTFPETVLATIEADAIIADMPEFLEWVASFEEVLNDYKNFVEKHGLE